MRLGPPVQILQFQKSVSCVVIGRRAVLGDNRAKPANKNFAPCGASALARDMPQETSPDLATRLDNLVRPGRVRKGKKRSKED
jgi:hypothetical protein